MHARRLPRWILLGAAVLLAGVWATVGWLLADSRSQALAHAQRNNANLALALSEQAARVLDGVNEALERLAQAAAQGPVPPQAFERMASETGLSGEILTQLSLIGPDGRFVGSNLDPSGERAGHVDLSAREHVRVHLAGAARDGDVGLFIGPPLLGKVSRRWTLQLSRRVGPRGQPAQGVVVASLGLQHFEAVFARVLSERSDLIALVGRDGVVRASAPADAALKAGDRWPQAIDEDLAPVASQGTLALGTGEAATAQLFAFHKVYRHPLWVQVTTAQDSALAAWRHAARVVLALAAAFTLAVAAVAAVGWRSVQRLQASHAALTESEARARELSDSRGRWLAERTAELQASQAQLVQAEKRAALGQLVSSVAHEINTPIAAIKATGRNIGDALDQALADVPLLRLQLEDAQWALFLQLLGLRQGCEGPLATREERARSRALATALEAAGVPDARARAATLVPLGLTAERLPPFLPLLQHAAHARILAAAATLATIGDGTRLINTAVERVSKIVYSLKALSHGTDDAPGPDGQAAPLQQVPLEEGLEHALTLHAHHFRQGVQLVKQLAAPQPLPCRPDALGQVWLNLITNALHAMQGQGTLTVRTHDEDGCRVVSIGDTGSGIAPEVQPRVFEPFFTTKPRGEGSGLGLDISRKIVEAHHGRIGFTTEPGKGTTFHVALPLQPA